MCTQKLISVLRILTIQSSKNNFTVMGISNSTTDIFGNIDNSTIPAYIFSAVINLYSALKPPPPPPISENVYLCYLLKLNHKIYKYTTMFFHRLPCSFLIYVSHSYCNYLAEYLKTVNNFSSLNFK